MTATKFRFTRVSVEALPFSLDPGKRIVYHDADLPALILRVGSSSKSYTLYKKDPVTRKPVKVKLGRHPELSPEDARKRALKLLSADHSVTQAVAMEELDSIEKLSCAFLEKHCLDNLSAISYGDYSRVIRVHILPRFGRMKPREVTRGTVRSYFEEYSKASKTQANKFLVVFSSMMTFALKRDVIDFNPVLKIDKNPEVKRTRLLNDDELVIACSTFDNEKPLLKHAYWLLLLLAQRRTETVLAEWSEFDWRANIWTIPGSRTKNGIPQTVPLPPLALSHWVALKELTGEHRFCFWSTATKHNRREAGPMSPSNVTQRLAKLRKLEPLNGMEKFTPHDLRRTVATNISALLEDTAITKRVLNHIDTASATSHYDLHSYNTVKRKALTAWEERLSMVLRGEKVPSLDLDSYVMEEEDDGEV